MLIIVKVFGCFLLIIMFRFQESEEPELLASAHEPVTTGLESQTHANNAPKADTNKQMQLFDDSVKTYYTEGTPLDTPYNFSTATSLSDLRGEPAIPEEGEEEEGEENIEEEDGEELEENEGKADDTTVRYKKLYFKGT